MSRIFITGSSDGLGLMAAQLLVEQGHSVVLHARNLQRAEATHRRLPGAEAIVTGDLASLQQMRSVADQVNALGSFDAIIHNAAVGYREPRRVETEDGFAHVFAINSLAPYVLTALIHPPRRLIYISSELHKQGDPSLSDLRPIAAGKVNRPTQTLSSTTSYLRLPMISTTPIVPRHGLRQATTLPVRSLGNTSITSKSKNLLRPHWTEACKIASLLLVNSLWVYEPQLSLRQSIDLARSSITSQHVFDAAGRIAGGTVRPPLGKQVFQIAAIPIVHPILSWRGFSRISEWLATTQEDEWRRYG
jgi:hypothetical protein